MANMYNNDNTLRETIRLFLNNLLNIAALVEGEQLVDFVIGKDFLQSTDELTQVKLIDGTYRTVEDTFTIGMISDFLGIPEPIKGLELISYTIPMLFLVSVEHKYDDIRESLERFVRLLIGEGYEENGYIFGTNCSEITNTGNIENINGIKYIHFTASIFITSTKYALIGNFIESYLGEDEEGIIRIYPTERSTTRAFIPEETHKNNNKESTTLFKESTWVGNLSFVINNTSPLFATLVQHMEEPILLNKSWIYRVVYATLDNATYDKLIGLQGLTLDGEIGNYAVMSITMKRSGINGE